VAKKKGFIKYALRHGYRVHPAYSFGECDTYWVFPYFAKLRAALNAYKIPTVIFAGAWFCPLLPRYDIELHTVIGPALEMPLVPAGELTEAVVDAWHAKYVASLVKVFDDHKARFGKADLKLEVL